MSKEPFEEADAKAKIGKQVQSVTDYPDIPVGSLGKVIASVGGYVQVEWVVPRRMLLDKSDYERMVRESQD